MGYSLYYYRLQARAEVSRLILAHSGQPWVNRFAHDWPAEKHLTPFGQIPVLTETCDDGSEFVLAQARAIERYLARKFSLLGSTPHESALIESLQEAHVDFYNQFRTYRHDPKEEILSQFKSTHLPNFIAMHSKFLAKNGNNGHYVGDKVSLADLHAVAAIDTIQAWAPGLMARETFPELFRVRDAVLSESVGVKQYVESADRVPARDPSAYPK
ncbi:hypothetical protein BJ742DRAFT_770333 [Cladochytrium replicatum]|nr:hypothetical protein BJ742DRAFT_770333 [Cladochytrium replicatum]